jgi:predicted nuclease with RNAse H fold
MHYCGVEVGPPGAHYLCALQEVRTPEPPVRLEARFYEPGSAHAVAQRVAGLGEVVVAIAAPMSEPRAGRRRRASDEALLAVGIPPRPFSAEGAALFEELAPLGLFDPVTDASEGNVPGDAYRTTPVFETNGEAIFSALQNQRLPARRHPLGVQRRIEALLDNHVIDAGGDLWHRRIDEIEAAAAAVCSHRFAVGHARWVGDSAEGVIVAPGNGPLRPFTTEGVLPPVTRVPL